MKNHKSIIFITILRREIQRIFHIWMQTLVPPMVTGSLYFIIFGHLMGDRIGKIHGFEYIQYLAPGVTMLWIINAAYNNVTSSVFLSRFQKSIEEMLVAPVSNFMLLLGFVSGGVVRALIVGFLIVLISSFFTQLTIIHPFDAVLVVILASTFFSLVGFVNGLYARTFDDISVVITFILMPLSYLGGVFYSVKMLSPTWQAVSHLNPVFYVIDLFRYSILGISDIDNYIALTFLFACNVALFCLCMLLLKKGVGIRA